MQDRVSLYPGRVTLTPVAGQENTYDMKRADQPTQDGDPLSKNTFLKDTTAALFGFGNTALPDDVLKKISELIQENNFLSLSKAKIEIGSYIGTGTSGAGEKTNIVSSFIPKYWGFLGFKYPDGYGQGMIPNFMLAPYGETLVNLGNVSAAERESNAILNVSYSGKTISWYFNGAGAADLYQNNRNGYTYYYIFLGWGE